MILIQAFLASRNRDEDRSYEFSERKRQSNKQEARNNIPVRSIVGNRERKKSVYETQLSQRSWYKSGRG